MKCAFCRILLDTEKHGECALIAPNGNGIVARLCNECLLAMGKMLDVLTKGGFQALEELAKQEPVPLYVPPSIWKNGG